MLKSNVLSVERPRASFLARSRGEILEFLGWAAKKSAVLVLLFYKGAVSPLLPSLCKFHPTCSMYAVEAVERHGVRKGLWLAVKRLLRCRPFSPGGCDPVPDA